MEGVLGPDRPRRPRADRPFLDESLRSRTDRASRIFGDRSIGALERPAAPGRLTQRSCHDQFAASIARRALLRDAPVETASACWRSRRRRRRSARNSGMFRPYRPAQPGLCPARSPSASYADRQSCPSGWPSSSAPARISGESSVHRPESVISRSCDAGGRAAQMTAGGADAGSALQRALGVRLEHFVDA